MCVADVAPADVEESGMSESSQSELPEAKESDIDDYDVDHDLFEHEENVRSLLEPTEDSNPRASRNEVHSIAKKIWLASHDYPLDGIVKEKKVSFHSSADG